MLVFKRNVIIERTFRGSYKVNYSYFNSNNRGVYIRFCGGDTDDLTIEVGKTRIPMSHEFMSYLSTARLFTDESEKKFNNVMRHLQMDIVRNIASQMYNNVDDYLEFEQSNLFKDVKREVKQMIVDFIDIRRERNMRIIFLDRVKFTNTERRLGVLNTWTDTFGYFVVPKNKDYTSADVRNMILVKSDPRKGYSEIVNRVFEAIRNEEPDFNIFKKDPFIQLNNELLEDIIPLI